MKNYLFIIFCNYMDKINSEIIKAEAINDL